MRDVQMKCEKAKKVAVNLTELFDLSIKEQFNSMPIPWRTWNQDSVI